MGKIRTTTKATDQQVIKDKAEFCQTLDDIARKGVELDTLQAAKEAAMQQVLTDHDPKISELTREIDRLTKLAEQWASPRRDELFSKGRKSGTTALTTYGYRLGQPSSSLPRAGRGTRLSPCSRLRAARRTWSPR